MALDPYNGFTVPVPGNPGVVQQINDALAAISEANSGAGTLNQKIVAFWPLWENSGTRQDLVGNNALTDNATVTRADGNYGNAAQFTAANSEYLSLADNVDLSTGDIDYTFTGQIYLDTKAAHQDVIGKWGAAGQREYLMYYDTTADRFQFIVSNDGTASVAVVANALGAVSVSTWYFFAVWHDATANTINIQFNNGTVNSTAHTTGTFDSTSSFVLGNRLPTASQYLNGRLRNVGFWKKVLNTAERTKLYNNGVGRVFPF